MTVREQIQELQDDVSKDIIGQSELIERLILGLLANGNLLVEGLPGLAKTRAVKSLATRIDGDFNRIQFTQDTKAEDIVGKVFYEREGMGGQKFMQGPVFGNIILADEVNRAPAKSQNSLLEAMEERQVTVANVAHKLPELFLVMATLNPAEQEGVFPLGEAQKDRFMFHVTVDYTSEEDEEKVVQLVRAEERKRNQKVLEEEVKEDVMKLDQGVIFSAREEIDQVEMPEDIMNYLIDIVYATRYPERYSFELKSYLRVGVSPRATLSLDKCSRAYAWLKGRNVVERDDLMAVLKGVMRHRISRGERALEHNISSDDIVDEILELIESMGSKRPEAATA
jgi:MoxR-like ATPase